MLVRDGRSPSKMYMRVKKRRQTTHTFQVAKTEENNRKKEEWKSGLCLKNMYKKGNGDEKVNKIVCVVYGPKITTQKPKGDDFYAFTRVASAVLQVHLQVQFVSGINVVRIKNILSLCNRKVFLIIKKKKILISENININELSSIKTW